jgi:hypothetical protein
MPGKSARSSPDSRTSTRIQRAHARFSAPGNPRPGCDVDHKSIISDRTQHPPDCRPCPDPQTSHPDSTAARTPRTHLRRQTVPNIASQLRHPPRPAANNIRITAHHRHRPPHVSAGYVGSGPTRRAVPAVRVSTARKPPGPDRNRTTKTPAPGSPPWPPLARTSSSITACDADAAAHKADTNPPYPATGAASAPGQ